MVQKIKKLGQFHKVGHAGTLDPLAEGVLLVLTDEDTKKQGDLMELTKVYKVKIAFGYESDSHDLGTPVKLVNKEKADQLTREELSGALGKYIGEITQQVPMYSAVHVGGTRLYQLARAGKSETTPLPSKSIHISNIKLCDFKQQDRFDRFTAPTATLEITCGKGTYIRSLVRDLGTDLDCGAVVINLIRLAVGDYQINDSLTIEDLAVNLIKS